MEYLQFIIDFCITILNNPVKLIEAVGVIGLIVIVFSETGLLVGFFLPGDSLLFSAGLFAYAGHMNIMLLLITLTLAAIIGDATGFYIGKKLGALLYKREDSLFFRKKHLLQAHEFYEKHGGKTIILGRFIPIIRTFVPTVAGAAGMKYFDFLIYNIIGGFLWVWSMLLAGYYLGHVFGEKINQYIHVIVVFIIFVSFLPLVIKYLKHKCEKKVNV